MTCPSIGAVVIGRNEGERLRVCLASVVGHVQSVVYVDSGSTDGSVELARSHGADVIELDMSVAFTMARGRNAGFEHLTKLHPDLELVQFIDGDCEVVDGWIERGIIAMQEDPEAVVVSGRRRERFADANVYHRLADMEWDTPVGEVTVCHGDAMMRVQAVRRAGGFNPTMIAGEEPELCLRMRRAGGRILRIDAEMTLHDVAMQRFGQWWKRMVRGGHAYAEGMWLHGRGPERYEVRPVVSIMLWTVVIVLLAIAPAWWTHGLSLLILLLYPLQVWRIARRQIRDGRTPSDGWLNARFIVVGKFAQMVGVFTFLIRRLLRRQSTIIEYKGPEQTKPA